MRTLFATLVLLFTLVFFLCADGQPSQNLLAQIQKSQPDTTRVRILLDLSREMLLKSGAIAKDIDSSYSYMKQAEQLSYNLKDIKGQGNSMLMKALILYKKGYKTRGNKKAEDAFDLFKSIDDLNGEGNADVIIGQHFGNDGKDLDQKMDYYKKGIDLFMQIGAKERLATTLVDLADLQSVDGSHGEAIKNLREALRIYQEIGYKRLQGLYDLLGQELSTEGDFVSSLKYELLALKTAREVKDTTLQLCTIYNRTATTYYFMGKRNDAFSYLQKALIVAKKYNDRSSIGIVSINLVSILRKLNRPRQALEALKNIDGMKLFKNEQIILKTEFLYVYLELKDYDSANLYFNELMQAYKRNPSDQVVLEGIIKYYLTTKQYQLVYPYLDKYSPLLASSNLRKRSWDQLWLFQADSALGRYQSAIAHYQRYKLLTDSDLNLAKARQTSLLEIEYETEKKNNDLQLQAKDIQLLKNESERTRLSRNWIMSISVMLLLSLGLLFSRYRLKQRSNRQLQNKQAEINQKNSVLEELLTDKDGLIKEKDTLLSEKDWLLKEIHHRVKNNLQTVISLLESQAIYLENDALKAMETSKHRIFSMSLIHQKLYQSNDLKMINMSTYLPELVSYLRDSFDAGKYIFFKLEVEPVQLSISQAVPLALVLNEAITNAVKHAFPGKGRGEITIRMKQTGENIQLLIMDNGVGMVNSAKNKTTDSLGLKLMTGLVEEINGQIKFNNSSGTMITITFNTDLPVVNIPSMN